MKIQIFSDIHNDLRALERLAKTPADLHISAGDLVSWEGGLSDCGEVLKPLGDKLWVLPGNHETAEQIAAFCARFGFRNFHEQVFEAAGYHFAGLGYSNPTPFDTPGEYSEEELEEKLEPFKNLSPLVLVVHAPPRGTTLDEIAGGNHIGSHAVRKFVDAYHPQYLFCGHVHEDAGKSDQLGETKAFNVGKQGYVLEI
jgi:Icc-related predicted phosphoesterase